MIRYIAIIIAVAALIMVLYLLFSRNQKPWHELTEEEKKRKKTLVASGAFVFLAGLITALLLGKKKK
jgi:uncharacterized membrane protein YfcA